MCKPAVNEYNRPFLKWAGGKYAVLKQILHRLPHRNRLIEPFVGGGAVFLNAGGFERYLLADINRDLINLYQVATTSNEVLIDKAECFFKQNKCQEAFLDVRAKFNAMSYTSLERAAAFLYLNRHCFNGLTRYNRNGKYNVAYGRYKKPPYFPKAELTHFASIAPRCEFSHAHYSDTIRRAGAGDVIFCDPPYEPLPDTTGFTNYVAGGFTFQDQCTLANELVHAHQRGAHIVMTNSSAPKIREMYESLRFKIHPLNARRTISCKSATRGAISDLICFMEG
ncbi:Dam family site-specific DNA-(adenine-N6)-methyltransferase [Xenorhabdus khoisanae]|uniref:DNA adenine methylase n=1 Tax=Xenorhabdus TaxID=626 RepID=UPI0023597A43|nr:Dam family site-specific DNA-(adenine-N6)-methyltransferase [Xenorhabdus khoisanae]MDC9615484.1 Dam family site-specific DNA-(adenine-N6)-methyltransferase [Xenorhabdus khoisanae]